FLATAHHADDQAETLLMRLQRGSGLSGLAGIRPRRELRSASLIRPLLGWRKAELAAIDRAAGIDPLEDPSNSDHRFDRTRIRAMLSEGAWDAEALARSASALAESEEALAWAADRLWQERAQVSSAIVQLEPSGLPPELLRRLLERAIRHIEAAASPRGEEIQRLIAQLEQGKTSTLAGVKCAGGSVWRFEAAPPRRVPR
ncbi:MAG TPA: tRNA lysidine(34) synthetase, partial [Allosphingosinicella sp.]|nr:tRNA lysidine(34) synthetase [Allosphingosinicella sp.]